MTTFVSYQIQGIDGQFKIPINQEDDVNTVSTLIKNDFSIIPELSAKIFGSSLQDTEILSQSIRKNDFIIFSPKEPQLQLTMSQQIIITPRYQSHTKFIVYSTINYESMTNGEMIDIDFDNSSEKEIRTKITDMLNEKYSNQLHQNGRKIKKILLFLPGGIPFFKNTNIHKFIESFPNFLPHLYSIVLYDDRIIDSILAERIENICDINGETKKILFSPYFESEINGLCEIASLLGYIAKNGPNSKSLIYSIAKFCPFAPLINGLFGLTSCMTGLNVLQITAPLSVLFVEMSKNLENKINLYSSASIFLSYFINIKISDRVPCTTFNRPFSNDGYDEYFHFTLEETTEIESIIAFNPDFEDHDWIRFQLPSLTEIDYKLSKRNSQELTIKFKQMLAKENHVALFQGKNGPCLFLKNLDGLIEYINPEIGIVETKDFDELEVPLYKPQKFIFDEELVGLFNPEEVTQLIFFCISKSKSMENLFFDGMNRFQVAQNLVRSFANDCYRSHLTSLYGSFMYNTQIELRNQLNPLANNFIQRMIIPNEKLSGESATFNAINLAAKNLMQKDNRKYKNAVLRIVVLCDCEDKITNNKDKATITNFILQNNIKVDLFLFSQNDAKDLVALSHFTGGVSVLLKNTNDAFDFFQKEEFLNVELRKFGEANKSNLTDNDFNKLPSISINELDKSIEIKEDKTVDPNTTVINPSARFIATIDNDTGVQNVSKRIISELEKLILNLPQNIKVFPIQDNINCWRILIKGSDDSLYANKWFYLTIKFDDKYPQIIPLFRFVYPPFHPNINDRGRIYFNDLDQKYRSNMSIKELIEYINMLLLYPNFEYPVDRKRAGMKIDDAKFLQLVTEWNQRNGRNSPEEWINTWKINNDFDEQIYSKPIYLIQDQSIKKPSFTILGTDLIDELLSKKVFLGKGATSTVYKVNNCFTHKGNLCLKILNNDLLSLDESKITKSKNKSIWDEEEEEEESNNNNEDELPIDFEKVKSLYFEYELLSNLNHPNIVKVFGFYFGDENHNPAILLEYCKFNLEKVIKELDDVYLVGIVYEICSAMKYVHENKIIHRDLKMKNILITFKKHVKICDFGISKQMDLTTYTSNTHGVGTLAFMAPEIFHEDLKYNEKVDVYAFGVILYFILTKGCLPKFTGTGKYELLSLPSEINKLSQSIIKSCWSSSIEKRPSFSELLELIVENNFMLIDGIEEEIQKLKNHLGL